MTERTDPYLDRTARLAELVLGLLDGGDHAACIDEAAVDVDVSSELDEMRATVAALDLLVEADAPREAAASLRDRVLGLGDPERRFEGFTRRVGRLFDLDEPRARAVLSAIGSPGSGWRDLGIPGALFLDLDGGPGVAHADCGLVSLRPGARIPLHAHRGDEWTFVLSGRAREVHPNDEARAERVELLEPGDLVERGAGTRHVIEALGDEPYVFAVVLSGGFHPEATAD